MLISKTASAFSFSVDCLFRRWKHVYFWTLTFRDIQYIEQARYNWNQFRIALKNEFQPTKDSFGRHLEGLRVIELHATHGVHFHLLINLRLPIDLVKRLGRRWGIGRVAVEQADIGAGQYLAKYLTKDYSRETPCMRGVRRWAFMGNLHEHGTRVRDVGYDTCYTRNREKHFPGAQLTYVTNAIIRHYSFLWGQVEDWPPAAKTHFYELLPQNHRHNFVIDKFRGTGNIIASGTNTLNYRLLPRSMFRQARIVTSA